MSKTFVELRRYERVPFFAEVTLRTAGNARLLPARTIDLSLGGVGLVTKTALERGTPVTVVFSIPDAGGRRTTEIIGRVVSLNADSDANRVGIEFLEPLSASRAPALVNRLQRL
jgi:c-di-GMP-binding flagellar brake protein YcgR